MTDPSAFNALRASRLASELTDEQCHVLAGLLVFRALDDGDVLVAEGTSDNHLHCIVSGSLAVVRGAGGPAELSLFTLTAGDLVGEMSFLDGTVHYAAVLARAPARVFSLEREQLESLLDRHPRIVYRVMRAIVRTVHQIQRRLSAHSVELSNYIYKQHGRY